MPGQIINPERQLKKKAMRELNLTGKQYRKLFNAVRKMQKGVINGYNKRNSPEGDSPEHERNRKDTQ